MTKTEPGPRTGRVRARHRWPWVVLGLLIAAIAVAALVVPRVIDVERHRGRIEQALREATGWEPELGAIDFSVLRGLVLNVSPASLSAPGEPPTSRFEISSLQVKARLLPLLEGRLDVRRIELLRPRILLVRDDAEEGWILPARAERPEAVPAGTEPRFSVSIDTVEVTGGTLRLEDRTVEPAQSYGLDDLDLEFRPARGMIELSAALPDGGGRFGASGSLDDRIAIDLEAVETAVLQTFVGPDLIGKGGSVSGRVDVGFPLKMDGKLVLRNLLLLAGEQPMERAELDFRVASREQDWLLESLELRSGDVRLLGRGTVLPALDVELEIPEAPVGSVLSATRAVFPFPLELESPGSARATVRLAQPSGGELTYSARGAVSAAGLPIAEFLPAARDLATEFELSPNGSLALRILDGVLAGGPLRGTVLIDSVYPPGKMSFEGNLTDAALGELLDGLVAGASTQVTGPVGLRGRLGLDLADPTLDPRALAGGLELDAREVTLPGWDLESAIRSEIEEKLAGLTGTVSKLKSKLDDVKAVRETAAGDAPPEQTATPGGATDEGAVGGDPAGETAAKAIRQLLDSLSAGVDFSSLPWAVRNVRLSAGGLAATGGGTFDPLEGRVDLEFAASFDAERTAALVLRYPMLDALVDAEQRLSVPLSLKGPMMKPKICVNLDRATKSRLEREKPKEAVKGLLEGLLGGKKKREGEPREQDPQQP